MPFYPIRNEIRKWQFYQWVKLFQTFQETIADKISLPLYWVHVQA